jgi:hypothetical protein
MREEVGVGLELNREALWNVRKRDKQKITILIPLVLL